MIPYRATSVASCSIIYEDELYAWIEGGRKHATAPSLTDHTNAITAGIKRRPRGGYEAFLRNIADELTIISGECTEIKQAQLTAATADDLNNMGTSIASAIIEKVDTM